MFDSYRYDFRLKFIDFEIFANEFSFEKKINIKKNKKNNEFINKNKNNFKFNTIVVF